MDGVLRHLLPSVKFSAEKCRQTLSATPPEFLFEHVSAETINAHLERLNTSIEDVWEIIADLKTIASMLLMHRNASPGFLINRLPTEILAMVFCEASRHDVTTMFAVSQTCTIWRNLALRNAEMWSAPNLVSWSRSPGLKMRSQDKTLCPELTALILQRSANAKMDVHYIGSDRNDLPTLTLPSSLNMLQECQSRLVELNLTLSLTTFSKTSWIGVEAAPHLKKLRIRTNRSGNRPYICRRAFAQTMPVLEELSLIGFRLPWNVNMFPRGLKTLHIDEGFDLGLAWIGAQAERIHSYASLDHRRYVDDQSILSVLRHCSDLEDMSINCCSNIRCGSAPDNATVPITLSKLRSMELHNSLVDCVHILRSIAWEGTPRLILSCDVKTGPHENTVPNFGHLPDNVFDLLGTARSIVITPDLVYGSYKTTRTLSAMSKPGPDMMINLRRWAAKNPTALLPSAISQFTERVPSTSAFRSLCIVDGTSTGRQDATAQEIAALLSCQPSLRHLTFTGYAGIKGRTNIIDALAMHLVDYPENTFPQLESLSMKHGYMYRDVFMRFIRSREGLPRLQSLCLDHMIFDTMDDETAKMICESVVDIESFDIMVCNEGIIPEGESVSTRRYLQLPSL